MAKLTTDEVATIRATYAAGGITQSALASQHGVTAKTIHRVITRATWRTT
jgi:DNA-binding MarR family transcriptional regulator